MNTVCDVNMCTGCMACVQKCPRSAISVKDELMYYNALIDAEKCINCNLCHSVCPQNTPVEFRKTIKMWQGWSNSNEIRTNGSSGGVATAISKAFVKNGGIVCSCCFSNGEFVFETAKDLLEVNKFRGSKYVKSNPKNAYKQIELHLNEGYKVLFIGLPCQVAGVLNYVKNEKKKNLYTIDLICHGTPSPVLLNKYLEEKRIDVAKCDSITFRDKSIFQVNYNVNTIGIKGTSDCYSIAFLNSIFYTENCYYCSYARKNRISDITLGDSWGSQLSMEQRVKGISLMLVQTENGKDLLEASDIHLDEVNVNIAYDNNQQLVRPSIPHNNRNSFFKGITRGKKLSSLVRHYIPKVYFKQLIKGWIIKLRIYK